ncbi:hypothetical protein I2492_04050 [Budviciaceae bacterium CWB-B4]|uniref:Uncharacterized protein n=1 Tax=Limnobaculum xujianqingii TaxID=2738837 RepID=A0A9D7AGF8_9GAMM|nr:hypothetical protein [Limnobaculum xujianqingii]MBK5072188.1 hypothetical protein [Limnobaculum xujianqingii]MBK5175497.1 hypothetical protein [Limnobaculum xujianqingii]
MLENKDLFGKELMCSVRDISISRFEDILDGKMKSKELIELTSELDSFDESEKEFIKKIVIKTVDNVIYNFLNMLEENENSISLMLYDVNGNRENIISLSDGLSGELFTSDGWINKFSNYR